jgi:hypothetical protein
LIPSIAVIISPNLMPTLLAGLSLFTYITKAPFEDLDDLTAIPT